MGTKLYKKGLIVGRFQPLHLAHEDMIRKALFICDKVFIMVGSAQESLTVRNPFSYQWRLNLLEDVFRKEITEKRLFVMPLNDMTNEDDISPDWGEYVLDSCPVDIDAMIYGNDDCRSGWFDKETIEDISELIVARVYDLSATRVRANLINQDFQGFCENTNSRIHYRYEDLMNIMKNIKRG